MNAQTLSEHELLDQIESSVARMIDILKNRPRFPTSPPPKVPPPPISTTEPPACAPSPYVIVAPPKQVLVAVTFPPKTTPNTRFTPLPPPISAPVTSPPQKVTAMITSTHVFSPSFINTGSSYIKNVLAPRIEWRPPWCVVSASPNAVGRTEWRPPWGFTPTGQNAAGGIEWRPLWCLDFQPCGQGFF
ncbi:hypothetical protein Hanom_Chr03g00229101 [Helianthus anomalus]